MSAANEQFLLQLLQACAQAEPEPLYPARFAQQANIDRHALDRGLDELRRRGLVRLTDWVRGLGQGCALTDAGRQALASGNLSAVPATTDGLAAPTTYERGEVVRDAIMYPLVPYVGRTLLAINIAVFLLGAVYAGVNELNVADYLVGRNSDATLATNRVLVRFGALYAGSVVRDLAGRPEFERILLASFLHIGLVHLAVNMYMLIRIGAIIESMWDRWRFLAIYLLSAIVSGCFVLIFDLTQERNALTAGASGSMFGIFAAFLVWFVLNKQHLPDRLAEAWKNNITINVILLLFINFLPGVSWQGHLGGAVGGAITALLLHAQRFHPSATMRYLAPALVPVAPLVFFVVVLRLAGWI